MTGAIQWHARERHPIFKRYVNDWATEAIVIQFTKNKRRYSVKNSTLKRDPKYDHLVRNSAKRDPSAPRGSKLKVARRGAADAAVRTAKKAATKKSATKRAASKSQAPKRKAAAVEEEEEEEDALARSLLRLLVPCCACSFPAALARFLLTTPTRSHRDYGFSHAHIHRLSASSS
ncbi:hypothetical protein FB45DRAFT_1095761 [Roridomyces roridus]|uniref:Uncharacterized protein n=1 Tax=Roridomyces roridus TaxID=1738132 RepID=A0AAD7BFR2_9AGAR|nr:hypothetical protein FB45DRAFT_1095761 [Roridomyces roridus]